MVSANSLVFPPRMGSRGLKKGRETDLMRTRVVGSGGHSPPYGWIPASAGMTAESAGTRPCRESEGVPRSTFFLFPQEWGIKGVENPIWTNHPNG
jgi:hypothetical protein